MINRHRPKGSPAMSGDRIANAARGRDTSGMLLEDDHDYAALLIKSHR